LKNIDGLFNLRYRPNTTLNMGIGATYKSVTLNLAYGFGFLNPDVGHGKTNYLDLQFHKYGRKIIIDLFGQFYQGYYLSPKGHGTYDGSYYVRPDLEINELGLSVQYVFNHKRFSYRASFLQNEWQKRSAGTFLIGFEGYFGNVMADSTLFPTALDQTIAARNYNRIDFFELGPALGYAYTLVVRRHFFLTGSVSAGINIGNTVLHQEPYNKNTFGLCLNTLYRTAIGYNSYRWAVSLYYISSNIRLAGSPSEERFQLNTNNLRLNFIRRFALGKKTKKRLEIIE
jgi:hypothetical protein